MTDVWSDRADAYRESPIHAAGDDLDLVVEWCAPAAGVTVLDVATGGGLSVDQYLAWREEQSAGDPALRKSLPFSTTFQHRFGSWTKALELNPKSFAEDFRGP